MTSAATGHRFAVLEVGGSHVTSAWVDLAGPRLVQGTRLPLDSAGTAASLLDTIATAAVALEASPGTRWAAAFPGPFDYDSGVARYTGVGKFDLLRDVDVRGALAQRLHSPRDAFHFVNDADAFALGEWALVPPGGPLVCLTLGTGVGSAFVADGACVRTGDSVPPDAEIHLTAWAGRPLEDTVSSRAIVAAYRTASGTAVSGVREVGDAARSGDADAAAVFTYSFRSLGSAVAPWLDRFGATRLTFGGSIAAAWDLIEPPVIEGLLAAGIKALPQLSVTADTERSAIVGAAYSADHHR